MIWAEAEFVKLKNDQWFQDQKIAGQCVADILKACCHIILSKPKRIVVKDLEQLSLEMFKRHNCTPTFLNYKGSNKIGFPGAICVSVNEHLVHGIPSDYVLQDGDKVSIDLGATYNGAISDAAYTVIYGEPKNKNIVSMMIKCQEALDKAIDAVQIGKNLGVIGNTIYNHIKNSEFGLVTQYGGHGLDYNRPHAMPFVHNKAQANEGVRIQPGLTIAIEPMLTLTSNVETEVLSDKWTVATKTVGCHFEHTLFVGSDKVHIMTEHGMKVNYEI